MDKKWYILKTRNSYERKVAERVESYYTNDVYIKCLVPTEKITDTSDGTVKIKEELAYPGYVFIETNSLHGLLTEIKFIDGSQGFVKERDGRIATMSERDIKRIYSRMEESISEVDLKIIEKGDKVKILTGAFEGFVGNVKSIDGINFSIDVRIFNKNTELQLTFNDIEKVSE